MLRTMNDLDGYAIHATDGTIGHVKDLYFDDEAWVIRYLVVDTGTWLSGRKVLISPIAIGHPNWTEKMLPVSITKEQVQNSPDIDTEKPVSRQHEERNLRHYGYPFYWGGAGFWGPGMFPNILMPGYDGPVLTPPAVKTKIKQAYTRPEAACHQGDDPHLRSCKAVIGYHILANDGEIGHVKDVVVDVDTWAIRYIIVNTSDWWLGQQVLIEPQSIRDVSWAGAEVSVNLTRQAVKEPPSYDTAGMLDRK